jgi:protein-tyrosine phosphatase
MAGAMKEILFVCTGNIFRSMIAENALRHAAGSTSLYRFASAGTEANPQEMVDLVRDGLLARGIDPTEHKQRKLTPALFNAADLVIAIGFDHATFIKEHFQKEVALFNEVAHGRREAILDTWEAVPDYAENRTDRDAHIQQVLTHICDSAPLLLYNLPNYLK